MKRSYYVVFQIIHTSMGGSTVLHDTGYFETDLPGNSRAWIEAAKTWARERARGARIVWWQALDD